MADLKLGQLIEGSAERDAIHVAVAPVVAAEHLRAGDHIGFVGDDTTEEVGTHTRQFLGIVDPYLRSVVRPGERFWLFLYPQTITSLRHDWTHPAFEKLNVTRSRDGEEHITTVVAAAIAETSRKWILDYADQLGVSYGDLIEGAREFRRYGTHLVKGGTLEGEYTSEQFWIHYQNVTGDYVEPEQRENFFSCSC